MSIKSQISKYGIFFALTIIGIWLIVISYLLTHPLPNVAWIIFFILLQTHLYTGLFITAHDAMHGTVSLNKKWNKFIGQICLTLFMFNRWKVLLPAHHKHHDFVATENDPDYFPPNPIIWYIKFLSGYVSWIQIVLIAITFNVLQWIGTPLAPLLLFWIIPSFLSTFQLFYFGTYLPHRGEHSNEHFSHSQQKNHLWAFFSCYFFGYHWEHHDQPACPWWLLWKAKDQSALQQN
jgi:beta-carotene ketolase (CrtW type)